MKKLSFLVPTLALLSACSSYDPDIYAAEEKRRLSREEARISMGCQFADTQSAYRECLLATYNSSKPKTYSVTTASDGKPVAVVSNGVMDAQPAVVDTTTTVTHQMPVEWVQPVQPLQPQVVPVTSPTQVCEGITGGPCVYQEQGEVYEMQMPPVSCDQEPCPPMIEEPKKVIVTTTETVTEKPVEVVPMPEPLPEKTWWETYQEEKQPEPKIVCPCPDPNDPCPQCVGK